MGIQGRRVNSETGQRKANWRDDVSFGCDLSNFELITRESFLMSIFEMDDGRRALSKFVRLPMFHASYLWGAAPISGTYWRHLESKC
jgi:hypothetical protein